MDNLNHIAIVMDGNGRWAKNQGKNRTEGHKQGLIVAKNIVFHCIKRNIKYVTLYVFSTENWKRAMEEVSFLMDLLIKNLKKEFDFYKENNIKVHHFGNRDGLPQKVLNEIDDTIEFTKNFDALNVGLCINYGGIDEIKRASQLCVKNNDSNIEKYLDSNIFPPIDLVIRTGGQIRLSNFMLFSSAYSELYFTNTLWPDFDEKGLDLAIDEYYKRTRNYGS